MYDDLLGPRKKESKAPSKKINLTSAPGAKNVEEEEEISLEEALEEALEDEDPWAGAGDDIDEDLDAEDDEEDCSNDCGNCEGC